MKTATILVLLIFCLMTVVSISSANVINDIPGTLSLQLGLNYAQEVTYSSSGIDAGDSQTKLSWIADYKYPIGDRFRVGAALVNWKFDELENEGSHGGTDFCLMTSYLMGKERNSEIFLGFGSDLFRLGYRSYMGKNDEIEKGMFLSLEMDSPLNDDHVSSFYIIGVGYSF